MSREKCLYFQLIDGQGNFKSDDFNEFVKDVKLSDCGHSYAVVSIIGRQGSGKSTLLNHLFYTNFKEMDASRERIRTTQGVWLSHANSIKPLMLVMDLEGTDGGERGEDDTIFEKQSALFALVVSDIVLINMWYTDIGCEQAANKPLLKKVFQVMIKFDQRKKSTLFFVVRDNTKCPLKTLESQLLQYIQEIWDSVQKPPQHRNSSYSEFFNVQVRALSHYEFQGEKFKEEVSYLRECFGNYTGPEELAGRRADIPVSEFTNIIQKIWETIKENEELDLPSIKAMAKAETACREKYENQIAELKANHQEAMARAETACREKYENQIAELKANHQAAKIMHGLEIASTVASTVVRIGLAVAGVPAFPDPGDAFQW